jgi:TolA-binding protein
MLTDKVLRTWRIYGLVLLVATGCVAFPTASSAPSPHQRSGTKPHTVDGKAQQKYYDLGLQYYSRESYGEAKEAFLQVIELGPNTALGVKAQENLKKIERVLQTLEEIKAK